MPVAVGDMKKPKTKQDRPVDRPGVKRDGPPLTDEHMQEIERLLQTLGFDLRARMLGAIPEAAERGTGSPPAAAQASEFLSPAIWHGRPNRELAERVAALDAALQRMHENRYGRCVECGTPIGFERLLAQPSAERCLACQERIECAPPDAGDSVH